MANRRRTWCDCAALVTPYKMLAARGAQGMIQRRHGIAMVALCVKAFAAVRDRAHQDGFPRAIVVARGRLGRLLSRVALERHEIENRRGEAANLTAFLMGDVAGHG